MPPRIWRPTKLAAFTSASNERPRNGHGRRKMCDGDDQRSTSRRAATASLAEPFPAARATMLSGGRGKGMVTPISAASSNRRCRLGRLARLSRAAEAKTVRAASSAEAGSREACRSASAARVSANASPQAPVASASAARPGSSRPDRFQGQLRSALLVSLPRRLGGVRVHLVPGGPERRAYRRQPQQRDFQVTAVKRCAPPGGEPRQQRVRADRAVLRRWLGEQLGSSGSAFDHLARLPDTGSRDQGERLRDGPRRPGRGN